MAMTKNAEIRKRIENVLHGWIDRPSDFKQVVDDIEAALQQGKTMSPKILISNVRFEASKFGAYINLAGMKVIGCTFHGLTVELSSDANAHLEDCHFDNCILVGDGRPDDKNTTEVKL